MASTPSSVTSRASLRTADWQANAAHNNRGKRSRPLFLSDDEPNRTDLRWQLPEAVPPPIPPLHGHSHSSVRSAEPTPLYATESRSASPRTSTSRWVEAVLPPEPQLFSLSPRATDNALRSRADMLIEEIDRLRDSTPQRGTGGGAVPLYGYGGSPEPVFNHDNRKPRPPVLETVEPISSRVPRVPSEVRLPPIAQRSPDLAPVSPVRSDKSNLVSTIGMRFREGSDETTVQHITHGTSTSPTDPELVETRDSVTSPFASPAVAPTRDSVATSPMLVAHKEMATSPLQLRTEALRREREPLRTASGSLLVSHGEPAVCIPVVTSVPVVRPAQAGMSPSLRTTSVTSVAVLEVSSPRPPTDLASPSTADTTRQEEYMQMARMLADHSEGKVNRQALGRLRKSCVKALHRQRNRELLLRYYSRWGRRASPVMLEMPVDVYSHEGFRLKQPKSPMAVKRLKLRFAHLMAATYVQRSLLGRYYNSLRRNAALAREEEMHNTTATRMLESDRAGVRLRRMRQRGAAALSRVTRRQRLAQCYQRWRLWAGRRGQAAQQSAVRAVAQWQRWRQALVEDTHRRSEAATSHALATQEDTILTLCDEQRVGHSAAILRATTQRTLGRAYRKWQCFVYFSSQQTAQMSIRRLERAHERYDAMMELQIKYVANASANRRLRLAYHALRRFRLWNRAKQSALQMMKAGAQRLGMGRAFRLLAVHAAQARRQQVGHLALCQVSLLSRWTQRQLALRCFVRLLMYRAHRASLRVDQQHAHAAQQLHSRAESRAASTRRTQVVAVGRLSRVAYLAFLRACYNKLLAFRSHCRAFREAAVTAKYKKEATRFKRRQRVSVKSLAGVMRRQIHNGLRRTAFERWRALSQGQAQQRVQVQRSHVAVQQLAGSVACRHLTTRFRMWAAHALRRQHRRSATCTLLVQVQRQHMARAYRQWHTALHTAACRRLLALRVEALQRTAHLRQLRRHYDAWRAHRSLCVSAAALRCTEEARLRTKLEGAAAVGWRGHAEALLGRCFHLWCEWSTEVRLTRAHRRTARRLMLWVRRDAETRVLASVFASWTAHCRSTLQRRTTAEHSSRLLAARVRQDLAHRGWAALVTHMQRRKRRRRREENERVVKARYSEMLARRTSTTFLRLKYNTLAAHRRVCMGLRCLARSASRTLLSVCMTKWFAMRREALLARKVDTLKQSLAATASFYDDCVTRTERRQRRVCSRACLILSDQVHRALAGRYYTRLTNYILQRRITRAITRLPSKKESKRRNRSLDPESPLRDSPRVSPPRPRVSDMRYVYPE